MAPNPDEDRARWRAEQRLAYALAHAERGWHVFPLRPNSKQPAIRDWESRASTDPDRITRCWTRSDEPGGHGLWNIGIATGPSGLVVVDLDAHDPQGWHGWDELEQLAEQQREPFPHTYTVNTPSGGMHLYYTAPDTDADGNPVRLGNSSGRLGEQIDTRAHGGLVVAAGSEIDGRSYEHAPDPNHAGHNGLQHPAALPGWLTERLAHQPTPDQPHGVPAEEARRRAYVDAAVRNELARVLHSPPHQHNDALFKASANLGRLVAGGHLDAATVRAALVGVREQVGHPEPGEARATVDSGLRAGAAQPRLTTDQTGNGDVGSREGARETTTLTRPPSAGPGHAEQGDTARTGDQEPAVAPVSADTRQAAAASLQRRTEPVKTTDRDGEVLPTRVAEHLARSATRRGSTPLGEVEAERRNYVEAGARGLYATELAAGDAEPHHATMAQLGQLHGGGWMHPSTVYAGTCHCCTPHTNTSTTDTPNTSTTCHSNRESPPAAVDGETSAPAHHAGDEPPTSPHTTPVTSDADDPTADVEVPAGDPTTSPAVEAGGDGDTPGQADTAAVVERARLAAADLRRRLQEAEQRARARNRGHTVTYTPDGTRIERGEALA